MKIRVFEKKLDDGSFDPVYIRYIKDGDVFKLFEGGKEVKDENGFNLFKAVGNPFMDEEGYWQVNYEPVDKV